MRVHALRVVAIAASASLAACSWGEFDDLRGQTWAGSTGKPDVKSSDWGIAVQRGTRTGDGGSLVVIGAGPPTSSTLAYTTAGDASLAEAAIDLSAQYAITALDAQPIVIADPTSDDAALIVSSGADSITVLAGTSLHQLLVQPSTVDAATYMQAPDRIDPPRAGDPQPVQPLVASGDRVIGTFYIAPPTPQPTCKLADAGVAVTPRALGTIRAGAVDDVLAWGANGHLYRYRADVFNGCATPEEPLGAVDTGFAPGHGSQILALDATHVVLQGHHDADETSVLQIYDTAALAAVGGAVTLPGLRTAAVLEAGGAAYVVAGYPSELVDGKTSGQALVFRTLATGLDAAPALALHDAQPTADQAFGRAVAAMPFNGTQVIAVAADNEIFVYFRAVLADGTALYDETREGR
jgi:hypothetical protein